MCLGLINYRASRRLGVGGLGFPVFPPCRFSIKQPCQPNQVVMVPCAFHAQVEEQINALYLDYRYANLMASTINIVLWCKSTSRRSLYGPQYLAARDCLQTLKQCASIAQRTQSKLSGVLLKAPSCIMDRVDHRIRNRSIPTLAPTLCAVGTLPQ